MRLSDEIQKYRVPDPSDQRVTVYEDECESCRIDYSGTGKAPLDDPNERRFSGLTEENG